jgi:hypothetical protein
MWLRLPSGYCCAEAIKAKGNESKRTFVAGAAAGLSCRVAVKQANQISARPPISSSTSSSALGSWESMVLSAHLQRAASRGLKPIMRAFGLIFRMLSATVELFRSGSSASMQTASTLGNVCTSPRLRFRSTPSPRYAWPIPAAVCAWKARLFSLVQ